MVEISAATKLTTVRQKLCCRKSKLYRVTDTSFEFQGEFQTEKYSKAFLWDPWNVFNEDTQKKDTFCTSGVVMHTPLTTNTKLLEIMYKFYGHDGDLVETNN